MANYRWGHSIARKGIFHVTALTGYVHRLRRVLGDGGEDPVIVFSGNGYALPLDPRMVDIGLFRHLVDTARTARDQGNPAESFELLKKGLKLWEPTPLAGIHGAYVDDRRTRLNQTRLPTLEELVEMELSLGRHSQVPDKLHAALASESLRERLHELQILALYRSGRRAAALIAYEDIRRVLRQELGVQPGSGSHRSFLLNRFATPAPTDLLRSRPWPP
jgi:DNA-binding SARP family transcriptional activator